MTTDIFRVGDNYVANFWWSQQDSLFKFQYTARRSMAMRFTNPDFADRIELRLRAIHAPTRVERERIS